MSTEPDMTSRRVTKMNVARNTKLANNDSEWLTAVSAVESASRRSLGYARAGDGARADGAGEG